MSNAPGREPCPFCGKLISARADRCRFCGEWLTEEEEEFEEEDLDDEGELPRHHRRRDNDLQPTDLLIPTNVSGWAIASCYLGLIGFCLPFIGLLFAIPAFICGIMAMTRRPVKKATYGSVTGNIRAVIGLILSGLAIVGWGGLLILLLTKRI